MNPRLVLNVATVLMLGVAATLFVGCGSVEPDSIVVSDQPPEVIEWSIGPKGGLNEGSAFITQASWEPKKLEVPVGRPFIIRFMPRDDRSHPIVFSKGLKEETGLDLEDLMVMGGNPAETPPMVIQSYGKGFDIYCREHRGVAGFGTIVTPSK